MVDYSHRRTPYMVLLSDIKVSREAASRRKGLHWAGVLGLVLAVFTIEQTLVAIPLVPLMFKEAWKSIDSGEGFDTAALMSDPKVMLISLYGTITCILATLFFACKVEKMPLSCLGMKKKGFLWRYPAGLAAGFAAMSGAVFLCRALGGLNFLPGKFSPLLTIAFTFGWVIQGFSEELLCRGYLMVSLGKRYPAYVAVTVNSLVFALFHSLNPGLSLLAVINLFLFGIFASLVFLVSENIWLIAAFHTIWNMSQGNIYGVLVSGSPVITSVVSCEMVPDKDFITGGAFGLEGGICVTSVYLAGIVIAYLLYRKKNISPAQPA